MQIELHKHSVINADVIIAVVFGLGVVALVFLTYGLYVFLFLFAMSILLPLAWRRYLRSLTFDFASRTVRWVSVISLFRQTFDFEEIEYVQLLSSIGPVPAQNLVVRRIGAIQPLLFEVRSPAERALAQELLDALRATIPEKVLS